MRQSDAKIRKMIRELNKHLDNSGKSLLVRRGRIVGILGNERLFYAKRKRRKK